MLEAGNRVRTTIEGYSGPKHGEIVTISRVKNYPGLSGGTHQIVWLDEYPGGWHRGGNFVKLDNPARKLYPHSVIQATTTDGQVHNLTVMDPTFETFDPQDAVGRWVPMTDIVSFEVLFEGIPN